MLKGNCWISNPSTNGNFLHSIEEIEVGYEIVKPSNDEEIESKQKIEQIEGMQYLGVR